MPIIILQRIRTLYVLIAMSRNDVILVVSLGRKYYVFSRLNADTEWSKQWVKKNLYDRRYTFSRAKALLLTHNIQRRVRTEYGVWEMKCD